MSQLFRLPAGGLIDRSRPLRFVWDGRDYEGYVGDTLASALLANGVRLVGRSFKYHRPRGIMAAGVEESNALVRLGEGARATPNVRATEVPLYDDLRATPENCWPSLRFDVSGIVNGTFARFLAAGFYYKTFMWPDWRWFEPAIRRAAGIGRVSGEADPDLYESRFAHCDVLVIGAGPSGLAAARVAASSGARVILAEQDVAVGGSMLYEGGEIEGHAASEWAEAAGRALAASPDTTVLTRTAAIGYHDHNLVTLVQQVADERMCTANPRVPRTRTWMVRAKHVILATGAIERPIVFPNNDRPGIMLAGASRQYLRRFGVLPGMRAVVFTSNDDAYRTAAAFADAGAPPIAVVDARPGPPSPFAAALMPSGLPIISGGAVVATRGTFALTAVQIRETSGITRWIECDHLAVSGGRNPTTHLFSQSGGELSWRDHIAAFVPNTPAQQTTSVGAATGAEGLRAALDQGIEAGVKAALAAGYEPSTLTLRCSRVPETETKPMTACWEIRGKGKAFVDLQNDVTTEDIALAVRENFRSVEHLKRYTTLGMAPDQGKTANVNGLALLGAATGRTPAETGYTRYRFPYTPVPLGAIGGRRRGALFTPLRRLPGHDRHLAARALFEDHGGWARPTAYPRPGETVAEAEQREARAVRLGAGLFEASPLGKIEVVGPDAARFLDLIYANTVSTLKPGRVRYGLMLNELGVVIDDGVAVRLADDRFLVCTSSGGADRIAGWLDEWLQCEWPDLEVVLAPVTSAWGVLTLTGPLARDILRAAATDIPLDEMPHMSFFEGLVAGLPARVLRVSYTGEVSFEINVPARSIGVLWDRLFEVGDPFGVTPVGVDAWMVLRTEKGYVHIGTDTDGSTTALDIGWTQVLKKKSDFIGKRSLLRPENQRDDRMQLVGFEVGPGEAPLDVGSNIVVTSGVIGKTSEGYVTSSVRSPTLTAPAAIGLLRAGRARYGQHVVLLDHLGRERRARIVTPAFYDPTGERLK